MVNVEHFKAMLKGKSKDESEPVTATAKDEDTDAGQDGPDKEDGLSPGDQALKAVEAKDGAALEEAIIRCLEKHKSGGY